MTDADTGSNPGMPLPRRSALGLGALLFDTQPDPAADRATGAATGFELAVQRRIWAVAAALRGAEGVEEAVPGMNNLLVTFDPLQLEEGALEAMFDRLWHKTAARGGASTAEGRTMEIPVVYGGAFGEDLAALARHAGLGIEEVVTLHSGGDYCVAAVGAMAGFPYLSGLDPRLAMGRRAVPRARVEAGAVAIGGQQAGIMPCAAPTGWHIIGRTDVRLFDPEAAMPSLLRPGDTVRFTVADIADGAR